MEKGIIKLETPELQSIEKSKAQQIRETFEPMVEMLEGFEKAFTEVVNESQKEVTPDLTAKAKRLRIDISKVRIQTGKLKDEGKAEYLRAERAIQAVHNIIVWAVTDKEEKLKEIEKHFEIQEQKRLEKLQADRAEKLSKYVEDADERDLASMDEDVWKAYYSTKKQEHEDRIAAEKKAEAERKAREKAEAEERERIRQENIRLQKEAEERERKAEAERKEREKQEAARLEKEAKEREAYEAKLKAERQERERMQKELEAKAEAERKTKEEEEARVQAELSKDDVAKVSDLIADLEALKNKYTFKSQKNRTMYKAVGQLIDKIIAYIK